MLTILLTTTHLLAFFTTSNIHYAYGKTIWVLLTCKIVEIRVLLISYCASHLCRRPERKGYMLFWNQQTAYIIDSFVSNKTITGGGALWVHFFSRYVYSLSILLAQFARKPHPQSSRAHARARFALSQFFFLRAKIERDSNKSKWHTRTDQAIVWPVPYAVGMRTAISPGQR